MQPDMLSPRTKSPRANWPAVAWWLWCIACVALLTRAWYMPKRQTVHFNYTRAGEHWLKGTDAYELVYDGLGNVRPRMSAYRYSPLFSAFMVPFSVLPEPWGGIVWRLLNYAVYFAALWWFFREAVPGIGKLSIAQQAAWWILLMPLSLPSMNNGQANVLMMALLLTTAAAIMRQRWNLAAVALAAAIFVKLYPVAIAMLFVLIYPRQLGWRLLLALLIGLALPFLLNDPVYVLDQYRSWYWLLQVDNRTQFPMPLAYRDFHLLTRWLGRPLEPEAYRVLQLATAGLVAACCLLGRFGGWPQQYLVHSVLLLGCSWLIAFGPATESCTFILVAPALAWSLLDAFVCRRRVATRVMLLMVLGLCLAHSTANWFGGVREWSYPILPVASALFFVERCWHICFAWEPPLEADETMHAQDHFAVPLRQEPGSRAASEDKCQPAA